MFHNRVFVGFLVRDKPYGRNVSANIWSYCDDITVECNVILIWKLESTLMYWGLGSKKIVSSIQLM